jgi:hypothetical protein
VSSEEGKNCESQSESSECLFEEVWLKDKEVTSVKPVAELEPFYFIKRLWCMGAGYQIIVVIE